jgi:superfamily II DNA or RNA helicase
MPAEDWQRALRRQFGRAQDFDWTNLGEAPVFSDFEVQNPATRGRYRVAIRGNDPGSSRCTCPDFASNQLGTCKHIEFVLGRLLRQRGAKAALQRGWQPAHSELWLHQGPQRSVRFRPGQDCPDGLLQLAAPLFRMEADGVLPWDRVDALPAFARQAQALCAEAGHSLVLHEDALGLVAQVRDAAHRCEALDRAYSKGARSAKLLKLLRMPMYPYQAEGAWRAARAGRLLIADEMGLGKTVQAIAAAELLARHAGVRRVLVVCPTSLKHQWQREITRFTGRDALQVQVLQGLRPARQVQWPAEAFCKIVNYETLVRDADLAAAWAPELMIIDEAQRVKNWDTRAAVCLKRLADPAVCPHVLVLTGTPLENRLEELISIVQLVDQHRLGPTWRLLLDHQQTDEAGRVVGYRGLDDIGKVLAQVLMQLPERMDKTLLLPLTDAQRAIHDEQGLTVKRIVQRWRKTGFLSDVDQRRLQCALQTMRMVCNSTWLVDQKTDHGLKVDELMTVLDELFSQPDAKVVVFSQWLGTHEVLKRRLAQRGWGHVFFNGSVPAAERGALVDRFHEDPACRLFLSTDAGSTGLNLQHAAATVVNMDLPWNPAVLAQRIGRVHRMGQRQGVQVINLVAQGSIEESIQGLLAFKQSVADGVLDGGDGTVFMEGGRLSRFMKQVDAVTAGIAAEDVQEPVPLAGLAEPVASTVDVQADWQTEASQTAPVASDLPAATPSAADPWAPLLQAGMALLAQLAQPASAAGSGPAAPGLSALVHTDAATGERQLRLPLPAPATLQRLADGLAALATALQPPGRS